ncbi:MAG: MmcQ/YjbR family DNA-binding protein, partial [Clostridia bacterium]|nr:MmcQ/YjbR family DNA-binding protein [Clostridia bacterium]
EATVDNQRFFMGYHMNKKHWYTLLLDGSIPTEEICRRIDESYLLAKK